MGKFVFFNYPKIKGVPAEESVPTAEEIPIPKPLI
jgi:hypothetical protein